MTTPTETLSAEPDQDLGMYGAMTDHRSVKHEPPRELQLFVQIGGIETPQKIFSFTEKGIAIRDDISWEEYCQGLQYFKGAEERIRQGRSQYIAFGYARFGKERVDASMTQLEFEMDDVKKAVDIASIPPEMRHDNLSSGHYIILARSGLKPKDMAKWSRTAAEQNLTPGQLKVSIAHGEVMSESQARAQNHGILSLHGIAMDFDVWLRKADSMSGVLKRDRATREMLYGEIRPMMELGLALKESLRERTSKKPAKKRKARK